MNIVRLCYAVPTQLDEIIPIPLPQVRLIISENLELSDVAATGHPRLGGI